MASTADPQLERVLTCACAGTLCVVVQHRYEIRGCVLESTYRRFVDLKERLHRRRILIWGNGQLTNYC
jgi:hypothetical protein